MALESAICKSSPKRRSGGGDCSPLDIVSFPEGTKYAVGRFNYTNMWFVVKELQRRNKQPNIQVRFLSRLDGSTLSMLLPSPRVDWVHIVTTVKPSSDSCAP